MIIIVLAIEIFRKKKLKVSLLILASYVFYYFDSGFLFVLLLFSSVLDFYCGRKIYESTVLKRRNFFLILSMAGNLGVLAFFKYANFAIQIANQIGDIFGIAASLKILNIALPVGISFYTFQTMSYTIDIYRKKLKPADSFSKFALFVAFFPQLVAGPIIRASQFLPQLNKKISIAGKNLKLGISYISWGIVKKVVFADNIAPFVDSIFADPIGLGSFPVLIGALAFGIQIYCDFSAYTDIAIGCARILGFTFPKNFDKPYFARNPSDFWKRWHISLSTWLRDYLYIPLGGNRKGKVRTYINLIMTMLLGGLWHGASWNFVIWGGYHGGILAAYRYISHKFGKKLKWLSSFFNERKARIISIIITQYFVFLGWLIFRVKNTDHLGYVINKFIFLDFSSGIYEIISFCIQNKFLILLIFTFFYLHILSYKIKNIVERINSLKLKYWFFFIAFVMLLLFMFTPSLNTAFIYFQF